MLEKRELLAGGGGSPVNPPLALGNAYSIFPNHALSVAASGVLGNDTGYSGQALTAVQQTGVAHGSLTLNSNGGFTYTPTTGYTGSDSFTYKAFDGSQFSTTAATVTITVADQAPVVINPGTQSTNQGTTVSLPITASDAAGFSLSYTASGLPAGLSINASTGVISGALPAHSTGNYSTNVSVNDGFLTTTISFAWSIVDSTPPTFVNPGSQNTRSGSSVNLPLSATSPAGWALTYSASGLPTGLSINASTGVITGTPTASSLTSSTVTISANNGIATGSTTFTWRVTVPSQPTITSPGSRTSHQGDNVSLAIQASASGGDALTYSASGLPSGLIIDPGSGVISGSVAATGPATFAVVVTVTDSPYVSSTSFTWTVAAATTLPVLTNPGPQSNAEGQVISFQIQASAASGHSLTYSATGLPGGLSVNTSTGLISGTLSNGTASTNSGSYSVTVSAIDASAGTTNASFVWSVVRTTQLPVAVSQTSTTFKNTAIVITLQGSNLSNDPLTYAVATSPAHGTISLNGAVATYTPANAYVGADSFTFTAAYGQLVSQPATVSVNVVPPGIAATPRTLTFNQGPGTGSVVVASFTDSNASLPLSAYSAQIDWGDGVTSAGTIAAGSGGSYNITGSHAYSEHGVFPVNVLIKDGTVSTTVTSTANVGVWALSNATPTGSSISRPAGTVLPTHDFVLPGVPSSGDGGNMPAGNPPPGGNMPTANLPSSGSFTPPSVDLPVTGLISLPKAGQSGSNSVPAWNSTPSQPGGDGLAGSTFTSPSVALPSAAGISSSSSGSNSFNSPINYVGLGNSVYTAVQIGTYTFTYGILYATDGTWTAWSTAAYSLQLQVSTIGSGFGSTLSETMTYSFQYSASGGSTSMSYSLSVLADEAYTYHESGSSNVSGSIFSYALDLSGLDHSSLTASGGASLGSTGWTSTNQYGFNESGSTGSHLNISGSDTVTLPGGNASDQYSGNTSASASFAYHETGSAGSTGASSSSTYSETGSQAFMMEASGLTSVATVVSGTSTSPSVADAATASFVYSQSGSTNYTYQAAAGAARTTTGSSAFDSYTYDETSSGGANVSFSQSDIWQGASSNGSVHGASNYHSDTQASQNYTSHFTGNDSFAYAANGSVTASGSDSYQLSQSASDSYTVHSDGSSSSSGTGTASTATFTYDIAGSDHSALTDAGSDSYQLATGQVATSHSNDSYTLTTSGNDTYSSHQSGTSSNSSAIGASFLSWASTNSGSDSSTATQTGQATVSYASDTGAVILWSDTYTFSASGSNEFTDTESGNDSVHLASNDVVVLAGYLPGYSVDSSDSYTYSDHGNSSYTMSGNGNDAPGVYADHIVYTESGSTTFQSQVQGTNTVASPTSSSSANYSESDQGTLNYALHETENDSSNGTIITSSVSFTNSETMNDASNLTYSTSSTSSQVGPDGSTKAVTGVSTYNDSFSDTFTTQQSGTAAGSTPVAGANGSADWVVANAYSTTEDSTGTFTFSETTTTHVVGASNGLQLAGDIVDSYHETGSSSFSMTASGNDASHSVDGTIVADSNTFSFSASETGSDSFTDHRVASSSSTGIRNGLTINSSQSTTSDVAGNDSYQGSDHGTGASTLNAGVSTFVNSGNYSYSQTTNQHYSVVEANTDNTSSSTTSGHDVYNLSTTGNDVQSTQWTGNYAGGTNGSTSSETYIYDNSGSYTSNQSMSGTSSSTFGTATNAQTYSGTQKGTNTYTGHQTGSSNGNGNATTSQDAFTYASNSTNQSTWNQTSSASSSGTDSLGNAVSSSSSSSLDQTSNDTATTALSGNDSANGAITTWNLTNTTTDSATASSSAVNDATKTTGSAVSHSHSTQNDSSTFHQTQTSVTQDSTTHTTFQRDATTNSSTVGHSDGSSPLDSFTSDTTSTSHSTSHEDGTDGSQNFTVDSESGSTSNYQETFGSPGNPGGTTNDGHTGTATPQSFAFQATYTKTGSDHSTLHASGTIVAGVASYSGYNYQNTSALNFSLTASGGFGSMAVSAGGSSTTSVIGSGASAVTTSSTTISYSVNLQYLGWQVINPSDSYTVNTSAVTALATAANQGWSWVVSQASAAWQGLTDVAWTTVQTVWSGLQQTYTWMVSAGQWIWGVATTVVTFACDTATMVANGATFGMIPSLSAKANELRQYYGETYFWICNITGGAVTVLAVVGLTSLTWGVGAGAAAQIVASGAAMGVSFDATHQITQMVDGARPWGEFDYQELAHAAVIGGATMALGPKVLCTLSPIMGTISISNGINELAKGHVATGLLDIAAGVFAFFGGCFAAGTPLLTPHGDKPIEEFLVGDLILTAPENEPDAPLEVKRVEERFILEAALWELRVQGRFVRTTSEHPFFVEGKGWTAASKLQIGDNLKSHDGKTIALQEIRNLHESVTVYNLRITDYHTYFVGSRDWGFSVWAHNSCTEPENSPRRPAPDANNYRGRYQAELHKNEVPRLPSDWDVHHRIPQEFIGDPRFEGFDFHAPSNLQGVQGSRAPENIHQQITNRWAEFMEQNPHADRSMIEAFADEMDILFAVFWWR